MRSYMMNHKRSCTLVLAISLFSCVASFAGRGGGGYGGDYGGGYNHSDNYNNDDNDDNHGVNYNGGVGWIAPGAVYLNPNNQVSCTTVQQCDSDGNCSENQVCN